VKKSKSDRPTVTKTKKTPVKKVPERKVRAKNSSVKHFPIVAIGASAGGIEAFTSLLQHLAPDLGMAYVLIMHLSPTHKSALSEILQSKTRMSVHTAEEGMEIKENNVYVIPPNNYMSLEDGYLKLAPRLVDNFAIDYFFTALASLYKNKAIGVILSGTATDGTLGLKAIKAEGGITFAQNETAKFPGMPNSAHDAGAVDFLLSPEEIAKELARLATMPYTALPAEKTEEEQEEEINDYSEEFKKILNIVKNKSGIDFYNHYKQASIHRRVLRRMVLNKLDTLSEYYLMLKANSKEADALYDDFLINVTSFFRDPDFYETLTKEVFPAIVKQIKGVEPIRIWVAGCSTGEEAYSIGICLIEFLEKQQLTIPIQIFASDLDGSAIEKARLAIYPLSALTGVPQNYFRKYFVKIEASYQIVKSVREICVFAQQNLLKDPPFSKMNLISCQNVLIYLETNPQKKILQAFHFALKPAGYLFLGKSETIGNSVDLFDSHDKKIRLYSRKPTQSPQLEFTVQRTGNVPSKEQQAEKQTNADPDKVVAKLMLSRFVYPSVVVNKNFMITQFFGVTSQYLEPVTGKASFNILKMIREDLVIDLGNLLQQARKTEKIVSKEGVRIHINKTLKDITIEVVPKKSSGEILFLVVFKENGVVLQSPENGGAKSNGGGDKKDRTILRLEEELVQSRGLIRTTNEEYETTYEELQANNEEILSSNEELQSVNEELETSKEELQSAVEELTTTIEELRKRNDELDASQKELKQVNEQLEQFAFISSHDLQEPLRKILTFSGLLTDSETQDTHLDAKNKKYSEKINASAFKMSSLLKDLLSFSILINRSENFIQVDLHDILKTVIDDFSELIEKKKAVIQLSAMPSIQAEPIQMNQLFHNLISNALKFNDGLPVIHITSKEVTREDFLLYKELNPQVVYTSISVSDNGIGFEEKYADKVFSLFQRLNDKKDAPGTGIGLAICKKIVKNHGGHIFVKAQRAKGATFTVFLPKGKVD
jgi:two-component system CheB/CheR fusion protein